MLTYLDKSAQNSKKVHKLMIILMWNNLPVNTVFTVPIYYLHLSNALFIYVEH